MDLSVSLGKVRLKNPIIISAGEHARDAETILRVASFGPGAITTKTITNTAIPDPHPCYAVFKGGFLNCMMGAVLNADQWFKNELPRASQAGVPIIANLAGTNPEETAELAIRAVEAGASMIELPTHCPHLAENLEEQFPGLKIPPPEINDPQPLYETVKAVRKAVSVPIIVKLSPIFHMSVLSWVKAGIDGGMDAVEVADALGPVMMIDIETGQPKLGGPRGFGGLSGQSLKPLTMAMTFQIAQNFDIPVIGCGGVETWKDAVEYFMAGASMVATYTVGHIKGPEAYSRIIKGLEEYLAQRNLSLEDIKGLAQRKVKERRQRNWHEITKGIPPVVLEEKCTACGICKTSCIYDAIEIDQYAMIDQERCYGCNLCVEVCPQQAIKSQYFV
ncbi:MAG: 4Fe-4S binding protein [Caldiserica bacterium]|jgi:dihydroorotate dehydrogenase subfamily 1|nr:4Fe-4S binding protein [Caldisericota bacterium]